jgi:nucleotide-binding universal stress UspA family protein
MFRNILVAIDGSETSRRALEAAGELAESVNARLTLIAVSPEVPGYAYRAGVDASALEREAETETDRILREAVESLPEGLPVTTVLKHGNPGERIVEQVEAGDHDLLAMGSRGRGRLTTSLFGSVGAHVHHHTKVAMLVIHPEGTT